MKRIHIIDMLACLALLPAWANTIYVSAEYGDDGNDGTQTEPVQTIQAGVNKLTGGWPSYLWISNGVYKLDAPVVFNDKDGQTYCIVRSTSGNPADVVIDGSNTVRCIHCKGSRTQFHDITVENGYSDDGLASGFYLPGEHFVVSNCVVKNCRAVSSSGDVYGGGLYSKGIASIEDTLFVGCTAETSAESKFARGGGFMKGYNYNESVEKVATVRNVVVSNCTVRAKYQNGSCGGGAYLAKANVDGMVVIDCRAESCDASPTAGTGTGGGIYKLTYVTNTFENVIVTSCVSGNVGAGFYGTGGAGGLLRVVNCTFAGNTVQTLPASAAGYGGGAYFTYAGYEVANCRFSGNRVVTTNTSGGGGGVCFFSPSSLLDCVVENNTVVGTDLSSATGIGGGIYAFAASLTVSNCVIAANSAWQDGAFYLSGCDGALLADIFCVSNTAAWHYSIGEVASEGNKAPVVVRNSYFMGNGGETGQYFSSFIFNTKGASASVVLEYCTFVANCVNSSESYVICPKTDNPYATTTAATVSNLFVKGCVFSANSGKSAFPNSMNTVTNITYTYADTFRANWWTEVAELHNYDKSMMPGGVEPLVDLAADHRLKSGTPFINKGVAEDWMGSGQKNGPMDMGDGTYTIGLLGKYGVTVLRNNVVPRVSGSAPDYGCFEYLFVPGFVLMVR